MSEAVYGRSVQVFNHVSRHFTGTSLLDVGCGNGLISKMSQALFPEIQLLDISNYVSPEVDLPFLRCEEGRPLPVSKGYDTVLLLMALHHSSDPAALLREAWRVTRRRLIIIESVFGVYTPPPVGVYELFQFEERDQLDYAIFVDWLYNKVLHDDIPVPYNFTTPDRWRQVFVDHHLPLVIDQNLGQDLTMAPELHFLFVIDR